MSGIAVLRKLKDMATEIPVVVITATTDLRKLNEAKELGIRSILAKPFHMSMISAELKKYLDAEI